MTLLDLEEYIKVKDRMIKDYEDREKWGRMIERYLLSSSSLRLVFLLIDSRHAPTEDDRLMLDWLLYNSIPTAIIATKVDKLKKSTREADLEKLRASLDGAEDLTFIPFSSVTGEGREEIYGLMERITD